MSEAGERCVCDPTLIMRTRLLCGLYSRRIVPPRWRRLAQVYCLSFAATFAFISIYVAGLFSIGLYRLSIIVTTGQFLVSQAVSLWTGDEYIYNLLSQNRLTDVTIDSPVVFNRLQKQIKQVFRFTLIFYATFAVVIMTLFSLCREIALMTKIVSVLLLELVAATSYWPKMLVFSVLDARMLVLKRRLQRHGFRAVGRAPPQPYCQIYDEILGMLDATDNPLKVMLFFDLIFSSLKFTGALTGFFYQWWQSPSVTDTVLLVVYIAFWVPQALVYAFGHVALLESAQTHCDDMALFTVTQLIKNPTKAERKRMYDFLGVLEGRGARYRVLRALPLNARLVLQVLGLCTAQAFVFVNIIMGK